MTACQIIARSVGGMISYELETNGFCCVHVFFSIYIAGDCRRGEGGTKSDSQRDKLKGGLLEVDFPYGTRYAAKTLDCE